MKKRSYLALGVMSGTSLDGVDVVLSRITPRGDSYDIRSEAHAFRPYPRTWARDIRKFQKENRLSEALYFGAAWSEFTAEAVRSLLRKKSLLPRHIDVIGAHGQTVLHNPAPLKHFGYRLGVTLQLADLSRLALRTGIPVVGNFRAADVAAGGQGAPLAPIAHAHIFGKPRHVVAVQNLGGIGNVTLLQGNRAIEAFDTGPANVWIDSTARFKTAGRVSFDRNGALAKSGRPNFSLMKEFLRHPFLTRRPPKSASWDDFGDPYLARYRSRMKALSLPDALATVTYATVEAVARAYESFVLPRHKITKVILCGGGARNRFFVDALGRRLPRLGITTSDAEGVPCDQVEALSFAFLAVAFLRRQAFDLRKITGAKKEVILGEWATSSVDTSSKRLLR